MQQEYDWDPIELDSADAMTLAEAAQHVGRHTQTVRMWCTRGVQGVALPFIRDQSGRIITSANNIQMWRHRVGMRQHEAQKLRRR